MTVMAGHPFLNSSLPSSSIVNGIQNFGTRTAVVSACGIVITTTIIVFFATTAKLKQSTKITLLNLLATDIAVMLSSFVYGAFLQGRIDSGSGICVVAVFVMVNGLHLNHLAVTWVSFTNFLAVIFPLKHNVWITKKSVAVAVTLMWLTMSLLNAFCIIAKFRSDLPCTALTYSTYATFFIFASCDCSTLAMNISLCVALRARRRVHVNTIFSVNKRQQRRETTGHLRVFSRDQEGRLEAEQSSEDPQRTSTFRFGDGSSTPPQPSEARNSGNEGNTLTVPKRVSSFRVHYFSHTKNPDTAMSSLHPGRLQEDILARGPAREIEIDTVRQGGTVPKSTRWSWLFKARSRSPQNPTVSFQSNSSRLHQTYRRVSLSMIIICLWCCLFNIPVILCLFYLSFITEDRVKANYGQLGIGMITLISINILGDPFLYAWRFIPWKNIILNLKARCCGCQK